jgi:DNA-directed RNA polymerase specialized sigma subunit
MSKSPLDHLLHIIRDARSNGAKIEQATLRQEIVSLNDRRQAEAMALYWLADLRQREIAELLGISQPVASKLIQKGAVSLAARLTNLLANRGAAS